MNKKYINIGEENLNINQFINKIKNYDLELTRKEIFDVINNAQENNPSDIPAILNVVKNTYHLRIAF
ncbi:hypothetical protein ACFL20_13200 [Spirochaetota bacterium]